MKTKEEIIDRLEAILGCLIGSHTSNDTPEHQLEKLITEMKSKENDGVLDDVIVSACTCHLDKVVSVCSLPNCNGKAGECI